MGAAVAIRLDGGNRIERELGALAGHLGNLPPLMEIFGAALEASVLDRFEREESPEGTPWQPSIRARQTGGKTLQDRRILFQSITSNASARSVEVGTNLIYAGTHQHGATIRAKSGGRLKFRIPGIGFRSVEEVIIPARPFLGFSDNDQTELLALASDYVAEASPGLAR